MDVIQQEMFIGYSFNGGLIGATPINGSTGKAEYPFVKCYYLKPDSGNFYSTGDLNRGKDIENYMEGKEKEFFPVLRDSNADPFLDKLGYPKYTVVFKDYDGTILKQENEVEFASKVEAPANPTRDGYSFTGWDKDYSNVKSDLIIIAMYEQLPKYKVTFKDYDGTVLKIQEVEEGKEATAPINPTRDGYTFTGWDKTFSNVTKELVITARYQRNSICTVIFKDYNGTVLKTQEVEKGKGATAPNNPVREGYTFIGWDKTFDKVTAFLVVTAKYKENAKPSIPVSPTKPSETPEKPNTSDKNNSSNNNQNTTNKSLPNIDITPYMFNYIYYADMNEDLKKAFGYNEEALKNHYLTFGIKEGRKASPIFDARYYLNKYSDLKKVFGNNYEGAYYHFINSGISEGRQASKYFDVKYYGKKYADLKNAYGENYKYMAMHFMTSGINEGRQGSNDFNVNEYYKKSSEFEKNNIKQNYIKYYALAEGAKVIENNPINITSYMFDADLYYSLYPDLQKNIGYNVDGLKSHYFSFGIKEGRIASYVFNPVYYLNTYKDLSNAFGKKGYESAYYHFINSGINEGRTASKLFNAREYLKTYKDLVNIFDKNYSKALEHFVACGMKEGRTGSSLFSSYVYKKNNNDLSKVFGNNLKEYFKHYIMFGQYEKRKCF